MYFCFCLVDFLFFRDFGIFVVFFLFNDFEGMEFLSFFREECFKFLSRVSIMVGSFIGLFLF